MRRSSAITTCLMAVLLCQAGAFGQDNQEKKIDQPSPPQHFYKLVFRVLEKDAGGKLTNSRSYSEVIEANPKLGSDFRMSSMRSGDRLPMQSSPGVYTYIDMGVKIDTRDVSDSSTQLQMRVAAEVSGSVAPPANTSTVPPLVRQSNWDSHVTVPIGRPTVIFSSDNVSDRGKTEMELTATPVSDH